MSCDAILGCLFGLAAVGCAAAAPVVSKPYPRAWASSLENEALRADLVTDGNPESRWSSAFADSQWIVIDLVEPVEIRTLTIVWNTAAAASYTVMGSLDGAAFKPLAVREGTAAEGAEEIVLDAPATVRFLRLDLQERTTVWGFSIHEILVNGRSPSAEDLPEPPADAVYRDTSRSAEERAADAVARMSLREKVRMLGGEEMFYFPGNERLGLDRIFMADASMGLRLPRSTAFPAFVNLAATFNPELAARYGDAVGEECRAKGVHVLLGPGVNLYRVPQGGRNFEYLGEDPYLASRMVVPYIRAVQDRGVMATVKHFAANNHEWHRKVSNSVVDELTLRELYFPAFRAAVQEAEVGAVMTAYNLVNGEYAAQHPWLVNGVLRNEWGFGGLVMTDWWSTWDALKVIKSGVDLEMPNGITLDEPTITSLISSGLIEEAEIDRMVERTLAAFFRFGFYDRPQVDPDAIGFGGPHYEVAVETARQGIVLLRNEGGFLPVDAEAAPRIVLLGVNARETETSGHGAARVEPVDPVSILRAFEVVGEGAVIEQFDSVDAAAREAITSADAVFVSVATSEREANDRDFELDAAQRGLIEDALALSDRVVVLVTSGSGIEMASWIEGTRAVIQAWYGGNVGAMALAEIVFGEVNPSGRLPYSLERRWEDAAAYGNFLPHDATFNDEPIWGRERPEFPVVYNERLLLGYRHFEANGIEPLFPFGHGLSYTTFAYDGLRVDSSMGDDAAAVVRLRVRNTGDRDGAEVVQVYVGPEVRGKGRPVRELAGFRRVEIVAGGEASVEIPIRRQDLAEYDMDAAAWVVRPGVYRVTVGGSSGEAALSGSFALE